MKDESERAASVPARATIIRPPSAFSVSSFILHPPSFIRFPMPTTQRKTHRAQRHHDTVPANPLYGYDYNPAWPSILSVAHDEGNGGRVYLITDRPCVLVSPPDGLPLSLAGLEIVEAVEVASVKFRLWMSGPVPAGAAWAWDAGGFGIVDPVTNHVLNASHGYCADTPGPFAPLPPAAVVSASAAGTTAVLVFDRPVTITGDTPDDAITFNGMTPASVSNVDPHTLSFALPGFVMAGDPWVIARQPDWLTTAVVWPASGTL
jgi:hypothetical protein